MMKRLAISLSVLLIAGVMAAAPAHAAPAKPANVSVQSTSEPGAARNAASVSLSWNVAAGAIAYAVTATAAGEATRSGSSAVCASGTCTSTVTQLSGGVNYAFVVTAIASDNSRTASDTSQFVAKSIAAAPVVDAPEPREGEVTLTWATPTGVATGGLPITGYSIVDTGGQFAFSADANDNELIISNLEAGLSYSFSITANNSLGASAAATFAAFVASAAEGVPSQPEPPTLTLPAATTALIAWVEPDDDGGSPIIGYRVTLLRNGVVAGDPVNVGPTARTYSVPNLTAGIYTARVSAENDNGLSVRSPLSNAVTVAASGGGFGGGIVPAPDEEGEEDAPAVSPSDFNGWTKRMVSATGTPTAEVKFYAKNPVGVGKVQFMLNGREIAWVRAIDATDPKLRTVASGPMAGVSYLVRTITLQPGKNALEIYVDGERVRRVAYTR